MTEYLPDIYRISETIKEIQSKFIEEEENTLELGIYGYLNEAFANSLQNVTFAAIQQLSIYLAKAAVAGSVRINLNSAFLTV